MQRTLIASASALALSLTLAGCGQPDAKPDAAKPAPEPRATLTVTSAPVQRQTWPQTLEVQGAVAAWQEAQVSARVSGLALVEVAVNVGDRVTRGQRLARFDDRTVRADLAVAQATLTQAQTNARQAASNRDRRIGISNGLVCEKPGKPDSALGGQPMPAWMAWNWRLGRCLVWIRPALTARLALVGP
jgi:multidrug efflux pump subunit AcrA (membrane-fusion protein)